MQSNIRRGRWIVAVAVLLVSLGAVASAHAATTSKPYSLVIARGTPTYETNSGPANNEVASGETVGITATFTNETGTQQLGSANLFWPSGFNVVSASIVAPGAGSAAPASNCTLNGSPAGPCVQLRNLALAPGQSVTVTMSVTTPTGHQGDNGWQAEVKQANNFSGSPGNDLFFDAPNSQPFSVLDGASSLAFVNQPHNEILGNAIDGATDWFTGGATATTSVTVEVLASDGADASGFTGPVTAGIAVNPDAATLSGTTIRIPSKVNGIAIASFDDLQISASANGYELNATSGTLSPATSSLGGFDVAGAVASCTGPGNSCHPPDQTGKQGGTASVTATIVSGTGVLTLLESADAYNDAQLACSGLTKIHEDTYNFFTTTTSPLVTSKVATITITGVSINGSVSKFMNAEQICFGSGVPFIDVTGGSAGTGTLPDGSAGFIGLLPNCTGSSTGPCHDRNSDSATPVGSTYTVKLVADIPSAYTGDPWMR